MQPDLQDNNTSSFLGVLRTDVDLYFSNKNFGPAGNNLLYLKCAIQIAFAGLLYSILVFFTTPLWISLLLCVLLGMNLSVIGFNTMHEGGHQSFSRFAWLNASAAYVLNLLGGNQYFWKIKHNINHHTHTNVEGMDSDIDAKPFMRMHAGQPLERYHRFQHIYWVVLYGISYLAWVFYEDFVKYLSGKVAVNMPRKKLPFTQHLVFWFTKLFFITFYIAIPIYFVGWLPWLVGFLIITCVCGISISIVFQLAHVVEGTDFYESKDEKDKGNWAIRQVRSTSDFATGNGVLHWLLGGLNFQVEHHLFPRVSHIHYPAIRKLVIIRCREHNIPYKEHKSMFSAFVSHLVHLRRLGRAAA